MTLDRLIQTLVETKNEAADDALLEALRLGDSREKSIALAALIRRETTRGLSGVIEQFDNLAIELQDEILSKIKTLHHALRESGRSDSTSLRKAAMKLIALGKQGKLAYVLSGNLHEPDQDVAKSAVDAMVALARWVATETRALQRSAIQPSADDSELESRAALYHELLDQRPDIEQAVARAIDGHRGKYGPELLRGRCCWRTGREAKPWRSCTPPSTVDRAR